MRGTSPFSIDGQPRLKLVRDLIPDCKIIESLFTRLEMNTYCIAVDDLHLIYRIRGRDVGQGTGLRTRCLPKLFLDNFYRKPRYTRSISLVRRTPLTIMTATTITGIVMILVYFFFYAIARLRKNHRHFWKLKT